MKNFLYFLILCALALWLTSFQNSGQDPEVLAAQQWFEANIQTPYTPDWTTARIGTYERGLFIITSVVPEVRNFKWYNTTVPADTSYLNGTNRIVVVKSPTGSYHAVLGRFFADSTFYHTNSLAGMNTLNLDRELLKSIKFGGLLYFEDLKYPNNHIGLAYTNGVPSGTVTKQDESLTHAGTSNRFCDAFDFGYQSAYFDADGVATIQWNYRIMIYCWEINPSGLSNWWNEWLGWLLGNLNGGVNPPNTGGGGNNNEPPLNCDCQKTSDSQPIGVAGASWFALSLTTYVYNLDCNIPSLDGYIGAVNMALPPPIPISWEFTNNHVYIIDKEKIAGNGPICGYFVTTKGYC